MTEIGAPKPGLMNVGEEARPPYAVLPDASSLFATRARRFEALAHGHELGPYLKFLATLTRAQHDIVAGLPAPVLPQPDHIRQALTHRMPPVARSRSEPDPVAMATVDALLERLGGTAPPAETAAAIAGLRAATPAEREAKIMEALADSDAGADLAQRVLVTAGLQVHFARLAGRLVPEDLRPIADAVCPVCGSPPVTSSVVGWPSAHNTRFCTCSLCSTMWHVVRIKCVLCSSTGGITYRLIEDKPETVKAETCNSCRAYVKILYQVNDHSLEPLADDVATLGLDILLAEEGWKRGGHNPFLLGY